MDSSDAVSNEKKYEESAVAKSPQESATNSRINNIYSSDSDDSDFDLEYTCDVCNKSFSGVKSLRQHEKSSKHIKAVNRKKFKKELDDDLEKLQDESGDLSDEFGYKPYAECKVCKKEFSGVEPYRQHLKSKAHRKKKILQKVISELDKDESDDEEKPKNSTKHRKQSKAEVLESPRSDSDDSTSSESSEIFECKECDKVFSGLEPYYKHKFCKSHKKKLKQKELIKEFTSEAASDEGNTDGKSIIESDGVLTCILCRKAFSGPESALVHSKSRRHKEMLEFRKWKKEKKLEEKREKTTGLNESHSEATNSEKPLSRKEGFTGDKVSADKSKANTDTSKPTEGIEASLIAKDTLDKSEQSLQNEKENTLLSYESYKNYKTIMNSLKSEEDK